MLLDLVKQGPYALFKETPMNREILIDEFKSARWQLSRVRSSINNATLSYLN